jgi:hypothetical protein
MMRLVEHTWTPEDLLDDVRQRLRADGWSVTIGIRSERTANFEFEHELSTRFGCSVNPNSAEAEARAFVDKVLRRREFTVIAKRPSAIPHGSLIQRFRQAGQANQWSRDVMAIVARVLRHERLLTDAEAAWLETAGPAWSDDET